MREFKFRAWNGQVLEKFELSDLYWRGEDTGEYDFPNQYRSEKTVEQYTGLKDKNGVDIYEGDILEVKNENDEMYWRYSQSSGASLISDTGIAAVEFYDGLWYVSESVNNGLYDLSQMGQMIRVIGNIHENPELLTK